MVVRDVVEELLRVQCASQEEGKTPVGCLDDEADLVDRFRAVECVRVGQPVLDALREGHPRTERLRDSRE